MFANPVRLGAPAPKAHRRVASALLAAGLAAATLGALPLGAWAQPAPTARHAVRMKQETVEQRIAMLHAALKITPDEEANWTPVAQAMRDNEAAMQKLVSERTAEAPHKINAVDDLRTYERFTQAHVNGLKNLISSFETLYHAMPDPQKAVADQVFRKFGARGPAHAS